MYNLDEIELPKTVQNDLEDVGKMGQNMAKNTVHQSVLDN